MEKHIEELLVGIEQMLVDTVVGLVNFFIGRINAIIFAFRDALNYIIDGMNIVGGWFGNDKLEHLNWTGIPEVQNPGLMTDLGKKYTGQSSSTSPYVYEGEYGYGPVAGPDWNASDYFDTTDSGALSGNTTVVLEVDGQALGRASLTNINRLSKQAGYVNLNLAY